jgi:fermentation-respiration switch protein FrsA (DUF1100 family)
MRELATNNLGQWYRLRRGRAQRLALKRLLVIAAVAFLLYSSACFYFFLKQGAMIYRPTTEWTVTPSDVGLPFEPVIIGGVRVNEQSVSLSGWWIPAGDVRAPAVLYLHGNKGNISDCLGIVKTLHEAGASVFVVDYAGYGKSGAFAISEGSMRASGLAAFSYLKKKAPNAASRVVYGRSMGGGVAMLVAKEDGASINDLILESTFTSLPDQVRHLGYGWLPIDLLLRDHYPSLDTIGAIGIKHVLMIHGGADDYVPVEMGKRLARAAGGTVTSVIVPGAGHNNVAAAGRAGLAENIHAFLVNAR